MDDGRGTVAPIDQGYTWSWCGPPANTNRTTTTTITTRLIGVPICPDLLDYEMLGEADNLRGRVVRAFFWLMRAWRV